MLYVSKSIVDRMSVMIQTQTDGENNLIHTNGERKKQSNSHKP